MAGAETWSSLRKREDLFLQVEEEGGPNLRVVVEVGNEVQPGNRVRGFHLLKVALFVWLFLRT